MSSSPSLLEFRDVSKVYGQTTKKTLAFTALDRISFHIKKGSFTALMGPSGSGKTSVLNLAAGLDVATSGDVLLLGQAIQKMGAAELSKFRRDRLGFIFQAYNLFPVLSALENVEFTCLIRGDDKKECRERAQNALAEVGLKDFMHRYPSELSGGQQQRVAVARALASNPDLIFADEPTANLDSKTAVQLIELFQKLNADKNLTFLFSTHDLRLMNSVKTSIEMKDGKIENIKEH